MESEGIKESAINIANGEKEAQILHSEAKKVENINIAIGKAESFIRMAEGESKAIELISKVLLKDGGSNAASLSLGKQYVSAFNQLAKETNTMLLPIDSSNVNSIVSQAMALYKNFFLTHNEKNALKLESDGMATPAKCSTSLIDHTQATAVLTKNDSNNVEKDTTSVFDSTTRKL